MNEFAAEIAPECAIDQINFNEEGISKHIQDFFNEQRRYKKKKCNPVSLLGFVLQTDCLAKWIVAEYITSPLLGVLDSQTIPREWWVVLKTSIS